MGLTTAQAQANLQKYGPNEVPQEKPTLWKRIGKWLISPITLMLLAASGLSWFQGDIFDAYFIIFLTVVNGAVSFWQENKADKAVESLESKLTVKVDVLRDGKWQKLNSQEIVPDDEVKIGVGNLVPADGVILAANNLNINDAAITGESLPKEKNVNDKVLAGSFVTTGNGRLRITQTGSRTTYGKAIASIEKASKRSLLNQEILTISYLLSGASVLSIIILDSVLFLQHSALSGILLLDLSLLIAGVPVSLPAVMSIIISLGIVDLSKKNVIVRQMSALENLANINLLLTDKTGTLTQNSISIDRTIIYKMDLPEDEFLTLASSTAVNENDPIDQTLVKASQHDPKLTVVSTVPADSIRKRGTSRIKINNQLKTVSTGAPQIVLRLCKLDQKLHRRALADVEETAAKGYRTLAVAMANGQEEDNMELLGLICLLDPLRDDSKETIEHLNNEGIEVKIMTGDHLAITKTIAKELNLNGEILAVQDLKTTQGEHPNKHWWQKISGFSEVLPTDKFKIVEMAKKYFVVGVTGDGVNDMPPVSEADVGIAVSNAVDALKGSADVVITKPGIKVIRDALEEGRKIFKRLYTYDVYRISESYRLIITIVILGALVHTYPVTALQIILLAFFNDLPIVTLGFDRVETVHKPAKSLSKTKLYKGLLYGNVGVVSSVSMFYILHFLHLPLSVIQTAFFLKLTVSGHLLIFNAHTDRPWYKFLPSKEVIWATSITQLISTIIAYSGWFMAPISIGLIIFIWVWSFVWMQILEWVKNLIPSEV